MQRRYSWAQWRALTSLLLGVLLFSQPLWSNVHQEGNALLGTTAVLLETLLSGFASIYFEKVIKLDPLTIWERNFQLSASSIPVYLAFMIYSGRSLGQGWTNLASIIAILCAVGGILVALSIQHADSVLKTLSTTGAIVLSALLDHWWLDGPLTPVMMIAAGQVVLSIGNYALDSTVSIAEVITQDDRKSRFLAKE